MTGYKVYMPAQTSRVRENIEWSITYAYNATDRESPRVLLVGDSICNHYQEVVRTKLEDSCNVSFWASSKCVTDPDYFRELNFMLEAYPYDAVCFNNGLHSLTTDRAEWKKAYRAAVDFIRAKLPGAALQLVLCTPLGKPELTQISRELNDFILETARNLGLPVIDLFAPMDCLDRETYWRDVYHFQPEAIARQADIVANAVRVRLGEKAAQVNHAATETGPVGAL